MANTFKLAFAAALIATTGAASALTLNTAGLKANSVLTFTPAAYGSSTGAGVDFKAIGNMTRLADVISFDEELQEDVPAASFNQPVTKATVNVGFDLKITPVSGEAVRSGLKIVRGARWIGVANFKVDFEKTTVFADIIKSDGTVIAAAPLYTFTDPKNTKISLKGLVLNQTGSVNTLKFAAGAAEEVSNALALSGALRATLIELDWGNIVINVTSFKRSPAVSTKPLTAADFAAAQ
jgi:hypothetical protein